MKILLSLISASHPPACKAWSRLGYSAAFTAKAGTSEYCHSGPGESAVIGRAGSRADSEFAKRPEALLSEHRYRQAVQELLWLLETVSTAFQATF